MKIAKYFDESVFIISYQYDVRSCIYYVWVDWKVCVRWLENVMSIRQRNFMYEDRLLWFWWNYHRFCCVNWDRSRTWSIIDRNENDNIATFDICWWCWIVDMKISNFSEFNISLSIRTFAFKSSIKWIWRMIKVFTEFSSLLMLEKYINTMTYLFVECLLTFKSLIVMRKIIILIDMFLHYALKKLISIKIISASVFKHSEKKFVFEDKAISADAYCHFLKS